MQSEQHDITAMLGRLERGDQSVIDALLPLIYDQLRALAGRQLQAERKDHTLNATALVHEAYLKLMGQEEVSWQNRAHFLGVASQAMRRILIDYARGRMADKRGGKDALVTFREDLYRPISRAEELVALDESLSELKSLDERQARLVELLFFGGLTQEEAAAVMDVSVATISREWRAAKAWLSRRLHQRGFRSGG